MVVVHGDTGRGIKFLQVSIVPIYSPIMLFWKQSLPQVAPNLEIMGGLSYISYHTPTVGSAGASVTKEDDIML
jgi:hypothetical protein